MVIGTVRVIVRIVARFRPLFSSVISIIPLVMMTVAVLSRSTVVMGIETLLTRHGPADLTLPIARCSPLLLELTIPLRIAARAQTPLRWSALCPWLAVCLV